MFLKMKKTRWVSLNTNPETGSYELFEFPEFFGLNPLNYYNL